MKRELKNPKVKPVHHGENLRDPTLKAANKHIQEAIDERNEAKKDRYVNIKPYDEASKKVTTLMNNQKAEI